MRRETAISGMFSRIAGFYDLLNRVLSLGIDQRWRSFLADRAEVPPGGLVLDLAAGTLDVSLKMIAAWPEARVCALDFCQAMLVRGKAKLARGDMIMPCAADARRLPMAASTADCLTMAFGIRNISPRRDAFREMLRVLKPGGKAFILEFGSGQERIWGGLYNFYLAHILPGIGAAVSHDRKAYEYLAKTVKEFPKAGELAREMGEAGFVNVEYIKLTGGIVCLHRGCKVA